jgi:nitrate reductase gamma subunit
MDFLDWVRGPLLALSLLVFIAGVAWRGWVLSRLPHGAAPGAPERQPFGTGAALRAAFTRMLPKGGFHPSATLVTVNPYVFHIGMALVFFGYAPHIAFVRRLTGLSWPALPDLVMYLAAGATIVSLLIALLFRLTDPVLKRISTADDWITWVLTFLPFVTGMAVIGDPSSTILARDHVIYRDPLAVHLLSLELLLIWFPFGKLMHAFLFLPARMQLATFFGRRGVRS